MNRGEMLLDYLYNKQKYGVGTKYPAEFLRNGVTVRECQIVLGTKELRKIICELMDKGHNVGKVWEQGEDRFGNVTRYKRYFVYKKENREWYNS